jgi:hypothetical protein
MSLQLDIWLLLVAVLVERQAAMMVLVVVVQVVYSLAHSRHQQLLTPSLLVPAALLTISPRAVMTLPTSTAAILPSREQA